MIDHLADGLVERDEAARLVLLSALAGEHVLLLGPPGTAKSELARRLHRVVRGGGYFERLLTRFSVPEELFGPLSIKALEADRYHRLTEAYLPSATVAFLDEVFKANSAILNALLSVLNERLFDNGAARDPVPLVCLVAASNEVPDGDELRALHDRFLLRCAMNPVSDEAFEAMLTRAPSTAPAPASLDPDELAAVRAAARDVEVPAAVTGYLRALRGWLVAQGVYVSDRRWRRVVAMLQVAAWTDGRDAVSLADCALAVPCVWERPAQLDAARAWHRARLDATLRAEPDRYTRVVEALEQALRQEQSSRTPMRSAAGAPLYADAMGRPTASGRNLVPATTELGEPLYLPPAGAPGPHPADGYTAQELLERFFPRSYADFELHLHDDLMRARRVVELEPMTEPTRYDDAHVASRVRQVAEIARDLTRYVRALQGPDGPDDAPLWLPRDESAAVGARAHEGLERAAALQSRLRALREGFDALPRVRA